MLGPGGRPRKIRKEEFCPCCKKQKIINRGYTRSVPSWSPGYKETSEKYYRRFRHDDREFFCKRCNMKECYVEHILREREKKEFRSLELYRKEMIIQAERYAKIFEIFGKMCGSATRNCKTWPISKEDDQRVHEAFAPLRIIMDMIKTINMVIMIEYQCIAKGIEMPERERKDIDKIKKIFMDYALDEETTLQLEPLRKLILELNEKYGIPQKELKKKEIKSKQQEGAFGTGKWLAARPTKVIN